ASGAIVLDAAAQALLPPETAVLQPLPGAYARLARLDAPPATATADVLPPTAPAALRRLFFADGLWQLTQRGEFRDVCSLFVSFAGLEAPADLDQFVRAVMRRVDRFGGYFNQLDFGDKGGTLLVHFGAPTAYEDVVARALRCVLDLQAAVDVPPAATWRAGVAFGTVFAGLVGSRRRAVYTALGDTVNLAARLMMQAAWGQVLAAGDVARQPGFRFAPAGERVLKGFAAPVAVHVLRDTELARPFFAQEMVGRDAELRQLLARAAPLRDGQPGGVVVVYGEPGMGKSRLTHALRQALGDEVTWLTGQTDQIMRQAFNPLTYVLRGSFDQAQAAGETENKARFERRLRALRAALAALPETQALRDELWRTRSFLGALLDLSWPDSLYARLDAEARYQNTLIALVTWLQAECRRRPVVLELEDGHWLDAASQALLTALTRQMQQAPLLILITSRYADDGTRPAFALAAETAVLHLDLAPLPAAALRGLAEAIVGTPIDDALHALLLDRTQANPFFAQQILYYLQERDLLREVETAAGRLATLPAATFELPRSLNTLLMARLDRLTQQVKEVVQTAAVLGREFEVRLLARMLAREVDPDLARAEQAQIWSLLSELRYLFKHALLRDAAYEMQLRARLRRLHRLAAEVSEQLYAADLAAQAGSMAYHYEAAHALGDAASRPSAVRYLRMAGHRAKEGYENDSAIDYFNRALALLTEEDDQVARYEVLLAREELYHWLANRARQVEDLDALKRIAAELADGRRQAEVTLAYARQAEALGDFQRMLAETTQALRLAEAADAQDLLVRAHSRRGVALTHLGDYEAAQAELETAVSTAPKNSEIAALSFGRLGNLMLSKKSFPEAETFFERTLEISRFIGDRNTESTALSNLGVVYYYRGQLDAAQTFLRQSLVITREVGDRRGELLLLNNLGGVAWHLGRLSESIAYFQQILAAQRRIGDRDSELTTLSNLGTAAMELGDYAGAQAYYEESLRLARATGNQDDQGLLLTYLGQVATYQQAYPDADANFEQALEIVQTLENHFREGIVRMSQGHLALERGRPGEAQGFFEAALERMQALDMSLQILEALAGVARAALAQGDPQRAEASVNEILQRLDTVSSESLQTVLLWIYKTCDDVLHARADPRAQTMLTKAHDLLQARAATISDAAMRRSFLNTVRINREIRRAYAERVG
ncbi:MAG: tetratricopeptide repeat protein, partial [Anaerolineales bacterium]|nr:tetratricopeptide repeat protein [Anaerolineales bacterium]